MTHKLLNRVQYNFDKVVEDNNGDSKMIIIEEVESSVASPKTFRSWLVFWIVQWIYSYLAPRKMNIIPPWWECVC